MPHFFSGAIPETCHKEAFCVPGSNTAGKRFTARAKVGKESKVLQNSPTRPEKETARVGGEGPPCHKVLKHGKQSFQRRLDDTAALGLF